jgi:hypothetical protein
MSDMLVVKLGLGVRRSRVSELLAERIAGWFDLVLPNPALLS